MRQRSSTRSLPRNHAAVRALEDPAYYAAHYRDTTVLRDQLAAGLRRLGWEVLPGIANLLLCHLPATGPTAAAIVARARHDGVFVRDAASMSAALGHRCVRIAVKDGSANRRMIEVLRVARAS